MTAAACGHGGQAERTALAWTRTGIAVIAVVAFLLRIVAAEETSPGAAAAVGLLVAGAALTVAGRRRYRTITAAIDAGTPATSGLLPLVVTGLAVSISCVALANL